MQPYIRVTMTNHETGEVVVHKESQVCLDYKKSCKNLHDFLDMFIDSVKYGRICDCIEICVIEPYKELEIPFT